MNIGIISNCSMSGPGYMCLDLVKILSQSCRVYVLAKNKQGDNVEFETNVQNYPGDEIPINMAKFWLEQNNIETCIFIEHDSNEEIEFVKNLKVKKISIPLHVETYRNIPIHDYSSFDKIICPTKYTFNLFSTYKQSVYTPWGFDPDVFKSDTGIQIGNSQVEIAGQEKEKSNVIKFFCPVNDNKTKKLILDSYLSERRINTTENGDLKPESVLYIHSLQKEGERSINQQLNNIIIGKQRLSRKEIVKMYQTADVVVLPSSTSVGLHCLEAIGCGLPFIGLGEPPFNEYVSNESGRDNGLLIDDYLSLSYCFRNSHSFNNEIRTFDILKKRALEVRNKWSWDNNKKGLIEAILEKD